MQVVLVTQITSALAVLEATVTAPGPEPFPLAATGADRIGDGIWDDDEQ
jgi:hypothetical protein